MFGAIVTLIVLTATTQQAINKSDFVLISIIFVFFANFLLLGWLGAHPATSPFVEMSKISSSSYFILLGVLGTYDLFNKFALKS